MSTTVEPRPIKVILKTAVGIYRFITICLVFSFSKQKLICGNYITHNVQAYFNFKSKKFKVMVQDILTGKYVVLRLLPYNKVHSALKQESMGDAL